ncbi:HD domain-containing phosphohydrolase [Candidatus Neomarinimicrobiota bacterium]
MKPWNSVRYIFTRPTLASSSVGLGIHGLMQLSQWYFDDTSYLRGLLNNFIDSPVFGLFQIIIPFVVPYIVTVIGRRIRLEAETRSLQKFPQANPDLVMKLDASCNILFMNQSTESFLDQMELDRSAVNQLLPEEAQSIVAEIIGTNQTVTRESQIADRTFEFRFRAFADEQAVFLSGHDISKLMDLEEELRDSYGHLAEMSNFAHRTFKRFDPLRFDVLHHYRAIMGLMLREADETHYDKPTHFFLAFRQPEGQFKGLIYTKQNAQIVEDNEEIVVDPAQAKVAITYGQKEVTWSNWEDEEGNLQEYQANFHERVRAKVGTIERFVTFNSTDVALIGFYKNKRVGELEAQVLKSLTVYAQSLKLISDQVRETEDAFLYTIEALARAAEANDEDTGQHIHRVNEYSRSLAEKMGMDAEFVRSIHYSAQMHDVGKIHVHPDILRKPGKLTKQELGRMMLHPTAGAQILGGAPRLEMARQIASGHHEKYDGGGYPQGLTGEDIPLAARIVTMADIYDALRQERSYKPSFSHEKAFQIISEGDGRVNPENFDPQVLDAFREIHDQFDEIYESHRDEDD